MTSDPPVGPSEDPPEVDYVTDLRMQIHDLECELAGKRLQLAAMTPPDWPELPITTASSLAWDLADMYGFASVEVAVEVERFPRPSRTYWLRAFRETRDSDPSIVTEGSTLSIATEALRVILDRRHG